MGNVAKYLCFHERDATPANQIRELAKGKSGIAKMTEERRKLRAVSCLSPNRGSFEKELGHKKSCTHKPCIQDYVLYSVLDS